MPEWAQALRPYTLHRDDTRHVVRERRVAGRPLHLPPFDTFSTRAILKPHELHIQDAHAPTHLLLPSVDRSFVCLVVHFVQKRFCTVWAP